MVDADKALVDQLKTRTRYNPTGVHFGESLMLPDTLCRQAATRIEAMGDEIEALRDVVRKCGAQFRYYEQSHRAKGTPDGDAKADANDAYATMCMSALLKGTPDNGQG